MDSWFKRKQNNARSTNSTSFVTPPRALRSFWGLSSAQSQVTFEKAPRVIKPPEEVYYKPSADHNVQTLKAVMMNQSSLDQLPAQYNSCLLNVLEAYHDLQEQLRRKDKQLKRMKKRHARDINDFGKIATGWFMKERDYQKEVKRLEVVLANTEGGMEAVTIARSQSLIHGSTKASEIISKEIGTLKERNHRGKRRHKTPEPTSATDNQGDQVSESVQFDPPSPKDVPGSATITSKASSLTTSSTFSSTSIQHSEAVPKARTSDNWSILSKWVKRRGRQELRSSHGLSEVSGINHSHISMTGAHSVSSVSHSHISMTGTLVPSNTLQGFPAHLQNKPLPDIPVGPVRTPERQELVPRQGPSFEVNDAYSSNPAPYIPLPREMSFSFRPGDDASILSPRLADEEFESYMIRKSPEQHSPRSTRPGIKRVTFEDEINTRRQSDTRPEPSTVLKSPYILQEFRDTYDSLSRDDSNSSIVTAVRDSSRRNSFDNSQHNEQTGRPKSDRGIGNTIGDAVAAAAKALGNKGGKPATAESATMRGSRGGHNTEREAHGKERSTSGTTGILKKFTSYPELRDRKQ